jgi:hypothetical protein
MSTQTPSQPEPSRDAPASVQPDGADFPGKIQLAGWAVGAISLVFVLYYAITYGAKAYEVVRDTFAAHGDATSYTRAIIDEITRHENDSTGIATTLYKDKLGETVAVYYASDGCIAIYRPGAAPSAYLPARSNYEWSLGPTRRSTTKPPETPRALGVGQNAPVPTPEILAEAAASAPRPDSFVVHQSSIGPPRLPAQRVQVGCLNPHPGNWQGSWGPANGCWAPFYRRFNDGCVHYQMYNACQGFWDPEIHWTYCNPNHHL